MGSISTTGDPSLRTKQRFKLSVNSKVSCLFRKLTLNVKLTTKKNITPKRKQLTYFSSLQSTPTITLFHKCEVKIKTMCMLNFLLHTRGDSHRHNSHVVEHDAKFDYCDSWHSVLVLDEACPDNPVRTPSHNINVDSSTSLI